MSETMETAVFPALEGAEFMVLTTFRRDGTPVPTTVWFARSGDRLYVTTMAGTGKAKRVQTTGRVTVAPSTGRGDVLGPVAPGRARHLHPDEFPIAEAALRGKYPEFGRIADRADAAARAARIYLEIEPDAA